jgi:hypothetical protein
MKIYSRYLLLAIIITLSGCKKKANDAENKTVATIVGTWTLSSYAKTDNFGTKTATSSQYPCITNITRIFKSDGTFTSSVSQSPPCYLGEAGTLSNDALHGTWTLSGNQVNMITYYNQDTKAYNYVGTLTEANGSKQFTYVDIDSYRMVNFVFVKN